LLQVTHDYPKGLNHKQVWKDKAKIYHNPVMPMSSLAKYLGILAKNMLSNFIYK
jgi:hypothetical protein